MNTIQASPMNVKDFDFFKLHNKRSIAQVLGQANEKTFSVLSKFSGQEKSGNGNLRAAFYKAGYNPKKII